MTSAAGQMLARAVRDRFGGFDGSVEVEVLVGDPWVSLAFSGERHRIDLHLWGRGARAAADHFLAGLDIRAFNLGNDILADFAFAGDARDDDGRYVCVTLEALTVETG